MTKLVKAGLLRKMVLNVLSTLSSMLKTAKSWGYVCQRVDYANLVFPCDEVRSEARFFTLEQVGKIIAAASDPFKKMFLVLVMVPVPLPEPLAVVLHAYKERWWRTNPLGFLFVTRNNRPPSSNKVVEYGLRPVLDALKISRCGLHAFRHTHKFALGQRGNTQGRAGTVAARRSESHSGRVWPHSA